MLDATSERRHAYVIRLSPRLALSFDCLLIFLSLVAHAAAQSPPTNDPPIYGPFNAVFLPDGEGLKKPLVEHDSVLLADSPWSLSAWVRPAEALQAWTLIAGVGNPLEEYPRYLALDGGKLALWLGKDNFLTSPTVVPPGKWHFLVATFDGFDFHLYSDGSEVAAGKLDLGTVGHVLEIGPPILPWPDGKHFGGRIASLTLLRQALAADEIKKLFAEPPEFSSVLFEEGSKPWYVQTRAQAGYRAPQDPATMPQNKAARSRPTAKKSTSSHAALEPFGENEWALAGGWTLVPAPGVSADGGQIAKEGFSVKDWWPATVPGTVLTTMIDRGIYPDPDYGLNNLAIPESLNKQDYWYRQEFPVPSALAGRRLTLTFYGINYNAVVWVNGQALGSITGAFIRGVFDVTGVIKPGARNVLAVRISPPPHPGIPQEQSIKGGPGENGGLMCLDGPTFVATEGWDWIPAIRDRDTGIWQPVTLRATGAVKIGDPQVMTKLPLPDTSRADVEIAVPLANSSSTPVHGTLQVSFAEISVSKAVTVPAGEISMIFSPAEFPQLTVQHPRLWWPNGYGKPELYHLKLAFTEGGQESDSKQLTFGIREITYELSLLDSSGHLRRLEYSPTAAHQKNDKVVDVSLEGIRELPAAEPPPPGLPEVWKEWWKSWTASLVPGAENSPSIRMLDDNKMAHYLVIKVNGVRIACRGGNWGMDDSRKRVSRARLEPFFRLHHDANLDLIRNWVGQNTEQVFYDLADEYGLLVWNDFWESTQNYNVEAEDPVLFLDNARDTILRFRNHPSIVMWCGRNEGVPQPILNEGLADLVSTLDGTRYYSPSSNQINLQNSGPYKYQDPALYFTTLNRGFSVETGTASMSTLESFRSWIPREDQWPIDDAWAYHDWHASGNGETAPFMAQIQTEFGASTSLEDFERKAQMLNYVDHRAIFEGMNAHLWAPNSGRLLWMTQPAWPSNMWQILSSDYDTQASYYGTKKACETIHIQLDLSNYNVDVINNTTVPLLGLSAIASVFSLVDKSLLHREERKDAAANAVTNAFKLDLAPLFSNGVIFVKLEVHNSSGQLLSDNFYWLAADSVSYRRLNKLPPANLSVSGTYRRIGDTAHIYVQVQNRGSSAALANKFTLLDALDGARILPAYYSDNYFSLLSGESREIEIEYPLAASSGPPQLSLRGWNLSPRTIPLTVPK